MTIEILLAFVLRECASLVLRGLNPESLLQFFASLVSFLLPYIPHATLQAALDATARARVDAAVDAASDAIEAQETVRAQDTNPPTSSRAP